MGITQRLNGRYEALPQRLIRFIVPAKKLTNEIGSGYTSWGEASIGGTVSRASLGYKNVHVNDELGRTYRTVEIDTERAHLITWAFYRYSEGDPTLRTLLDELTARGLMTRATPKWPSKPLTTTGLHKLLRNPYYKGEIRYRGVVYRTSRATG